MQDQSPERPGQVMPPRGNANGGQNNVPAGPLGSSLVTIYAGRQMAEMERVFQATGDRTGQREALATLRRWQFDPRLDSASRQRASTLVWTFQPNGWDEI
jgi:hypothetical protein